MNLEKNIIYILETQGYKDGGSDYYEVFVVLNNKVLARFGDCYHDKGIERAQGFILGYNFEKPISFEIKQKEVFVGEDNYYLDNDDDIFNYEFCE